MNYSSIKRFKSFNEEVQQLHLTQQKVDIIYPFMESKIDLLENIYDLTLDLQDEEVKINSRIFFIDSNINILKHNVYIEGSVKNQFIPFKSNKGELEVDITTLWVDSFYIQGIKESWILSDELIFKIRSKEIIPYTATFFWSMSIINYRDDILSIGNQVEEIYDTKCKIYSNSGTGMWLVC